MENIFLSKQAKIIVDILLVLGFIFLRIAGHIGQISAYWNSVHCIMGVVWFSLIILHVAQHWRFIKSFTKKKVILKNKITALIIICFIMMSISIIFFMIGIPLLKFHNVIGHLFILIVIVHTIDKCKRFIALFKSKNKVNV